MNPTHALYSRSLIEEDEWKLDTFGDGDPIFAWVTIDAERNSVRFHTETKLHACFHDEGLYEWRPVTPEVLKIAEEASRKLKEEFGRLEAANVERSTEGLIKTNQKQKGGSMFFNRLKGQFRARFRTDE
jgi:hypothetical protein